MLLSSQSTGHFRVVLELSLLASAMLVMWAWLSTPQSVASATPQSLERRSNRSTCMSFNYGSIYCIVLSIFSRDISVRVFLHCGGFFPAYCICISLQPQTQAFLRSLYPGSLWQIWFGGNRPGTGEAERACLIQWNQGRNLFCTDQMSTSAKTARLICSY